jgi:hypothetical protein
MSTEYLFSNDYTTKIHTSNDPNYHSKHYILQDSNTFHNRNTENTKSKLVPRASNNSTKPTNNNNSLNKNELDYLKFPLSWTCYKENGEYKCPLRGN